MPTLYLGFLRGMYVRAWVYVLFGFALVGSLMAGGELGSESSDVVSLCEGGVRIYSRDCVDGRVCTCVGTG